MDVHPALEPLTFLIGRWEGAGSGIYPTIEPFEYRETIDLSAPPGKPFLAYRQRTRRPDGPNGTGEPLHSEAGFYRPAGPGRVELVIAQPTGIVEVHHGTVEGTALSLRSTTVARTGTAKQVSTVERNLSLREDTLQYELFMGAMGRPHQIHLRASLRRAS